MEQTMTIEEVLQDAINTINGISLPVSMHDSAGAQLARVGKNLQVVLTVMAQKAQEAKAAQEVQTQEEVVKDE